MSSLTLRLGTVRSSKATVKKKKECSTQKFEVKPIFLEELQGYCESKSCIPAIKWLSDCIDTMDVLKQAGLIKQIGQSLQKGHSNSPEQVLLCCHILADAYIGFETKNILKRTIASILQSCPEPLHPTIVQFLRDSLVDRIQTVSQETNDIHLRQMVDAITACLDNFSLGEQCIANAVTNVLQFSSHVLIMLTKKVREDCSPLEATQHSQNLQAVIRSTVLSLQKCPSTVRQLLESPDTRDFNLEVLAHILHNVLTLLNDDAILLDCRMSCGMASPLLLRYILGPHFFRTVFQVAFPVVCMDSFSIQEQLNTLPADLDFSLSLLGALPVSSQLCLTNGLLSTLQDNELVEEMTPNCRPLLHILLPQLLHISKSQTNTGSALTIACCRGILLWTQRACKALESCIETDSIYSQVRGGSAVSQQLLEFVWEHWEHFVDGVRHLTSDIFSNVIVLHTLSAKDATEKSKFLEELIGHLLSLPWHRRSKYSGLCCLVDQIGACQILEFRSSIPQDLLDSMSDPSTASYASELFEKLFTVNFVELHDDLSVWQQNWVTPVLTALCQGSKAPSLEHILSKLLKCCPETLQYVTSILTEEDSPSSTTHLGALIMAIKTARNLGLVNSVENEEEDNGYEPLWNNILSLSLLKLALHHIDDQIRLDAFGLLCESQRSTESLTQVDIELIEAFLPVNMSNQSAAFRQQLISQVKKLIIRIHDGGRVIQKRISQILKKEPKSNEARNLESQILMYQNFLIWLADLQFYSLHVGANFPRRGTALQILTLLHQLIGFQDTEGNLFSLKKCLTNENVQTLLECLRDTYENNKGLALTILATFPEDTLGFKSDQRVSELFEAALSLASSPRPSESVTAAYLFRLLVNFQLTWQISTSVRQVLEESSQRHSETDSNNCDKKFSDCYNNALSSNPTKDDVILVVLEVLMFQLQLELDCAKNSLLEAAATAPMYGILFCIRLLLGDVELSIVAKDEHWRLFIVSLIETCFELSEVVSPVVNNSSPEGHLPMDTDPASLSQLNATIQKALGYNYDPFESYFSSHPDGDGDDVTIADIPPDVISKVQAVTAQMLLLCSWRTMKEVSLLLGFLCQKAPIASNSDNSDNSGVLLLRDQVLRIGEYFTTQLAETKHRGAFEQAYVGFCKMCTRLWSVPDQLHQLPAQWLRDLLDHLSCGADSKLCSTRRSAGVPFMVQALVSSEPDVTGFSCLKEVLSTLLTFTLLQKYENTEARVHALNILRALFRDTRLGENVMPFIADGVKAAILGFKGQTWAVRNSATLLFSALMTRIFGVKHGKDENSRKNCMTGRVFFQRFPTLHQFLLDELVSVSKNLQNSYNREQLHLQPSVYPVLLLLARLYPSPLEGTDSNLQLAAFLPHVKACSSSAIIQTRVLAAKALVPLVPLDMYHSVLEELIKVLPIKTGEVFSQNRTHGTLLQIHHLLKDITGIPEQVQARVIENLGDWLHSRLWICTRSNPCLLTRMAYLDLIESCLSKSLLKADSKLITEIQEHILQEIEHPVQDSSSPGEALFHVSIARLALHVALVLVDNADSSTNSQNEVHWSSSELSALSEAVGGSEMLGQHLLSPVQESVPFFGQNMPAQTSPADSGSPAVMALQDLVIQLLMDRNYEVRLTVLQWLRVLFQGDSIAPDDQFISFDETSLQFIKEIPPWLTSYSRGRLCAQLLTCSRDLVLMLVSMALLREQHPECLLEVYHVICLFPLALQLPWPHPEESDKYLSSIEKLDLILQQGEAETRDDVRCALLRFSGSLVPQVYLDIVEATDDSEISPRTVLEEWADAFLICCSPEQSLGTRMMAANILIHTAPYLLLDPHQVLGSSSCVVWCAAVRLLNDDEPSIKQKVAGIVKIFHLSSPSPGPDLISYHVQPVLALDLLIASFVEKFGENYQTECLTTLLDWCLREDAKDTFSTIEEEDRLFDKGEMNIYAEEVTLTNIVIKHLKHLLRQVFGVRRLSRADFPNRMRATSSKILMPGISSPSEDMEEDDKQFPESLTSDSLAILSMPANVKNAVMTNFTIPTNQVAPWLSKTENSNSNVPEGDVFLLRDVVSMIAEELAIMLAEIPPLTNQTPFTCRHYERQIMQIYRRVVAVTSLAKYDTSQLEIMNQLETTLQDIFGRTVPHVNHLIQTMFTEIWKVTHVLANA